MERRKRGEAVGVTGGSLIPTKVRLSTVVVDSGGRPVLEGTVPRDVPFPLLPFLTQKIMDLY